MANRRFGRPQVRAPRRVTDWQHAGGTTLTLISVPAGTTRQISSVAIAEGGAAAGTIVRIRGMVHVELAAESAAPTLQQYTIGCGLFDDRAVAVSNAAGVPKPALDADDEKWMWWNTGFVGNGPPLADTNTDPESTGTGRRIAVQIPVDSKAMRKWDENQTFVWYCENEDVDGTSTEIDVTLFGRMLIKLP